MQSLRHHIDDQDAHQTLSDTMLSSAMAVQMQVMVHWAKAHTVVSQVALVELLVLVVEEVLMEAMRRATTYMKEELEVEVQEVLQLQVAQVLAAAMEQKGLIPRALAAAVERHLQKKVWGPWSVAQVALEVEAQAAQPRPRRQRDRGSRFVTWKLERQALVSSLERSNHRHTAGLEMRLGGRHQPTALPEVEGMVPTRLQNASAPELGRERRSRIASPLNDSHREQVVSLSAQVLEPSPLQHRSPYAPAASSRTPWRCANSSVLPSVAPRQQLPPLYARGFYALAAQPLYGAPHPEWESLLRSSRS